MDQPFELLLLLQITVVAAGQPRYPLLGSPEEEVEGEEGCQAVTPGDAFLQQYISLARQVSMLWCYREGRPLSHQTGPAIAASACPARTNL